MTNIATGQGTVAFVTIQPDMSTVVFPATGNTVLLTGVPTVDQKPIVIENPELRDSLGAKAGKVDGFSAGDLKLEVLQKVNTPGELPPNHPLLLSLYGRHTEYGDRVEYNHYLPRQAPVFLTVLIQLGFQTFLIKGVSVKSGELTIANKKYLSWNFSSLFSQLMVTSTGTLKTAISSTTSTIEMDGKVGGYDVGGRIQIGDDTNSDNGYEITGVDVISGTLTVSGEITSTHDVGAIVKGYVPSVSDAGELVSVGVSYSEEGGKKYGFTESKYAVTNGLKVLDEQTKVQAGSYPDSACNASARTVRFDSTRYFSMDEQHIDHLRNEHAQVPINLVVGGDRVRVVMPDCRLVDSSTSGNEEMKKGFSAECKETNGADESTFIVQ